MYSLTSASFCTTVKVSYGLNNSQGSFMRYLLLLSYFTLLLGCASTDGYKKVLDSWIGVSEDRLFDSWGYPASSFEAPNGNTVYIYSSSGQFTMPTQTNSTYSAYGNSVYGQSTTTGGQTVNLSCITYFEVDNVGFVVDWRFKGNNCRA